MLLKIDILDLYVSHLPILRTVKKSSGNGKSLQNVYTIISWG